MVLICAANKQLNMRRQGLLPVNSAVTSTDSLNDVNIPVLLHIIHLSTLAIEITIRSHTITTELFVNLESYSRRTPEIKQLLLDGYKKYYTNMNALKAPDEKNGFELAFAEILNKNVTTVSTGVTAASLTMLRTRFLLNWFEKEPGKYAFRLFDYQRQLTREGFFDAYNQWLFGAAQSLPDFQQWTQQNQKAYEGFINFQKGRVFKLPAGQNYRGWKGK